MMQTSKEPFSDILSTLQFSFIFSALLRGGGGGGSASPPPVIEDQKKPVLNRVNKPSLHSSHSIRPKINKPSGVGYLVNKPLQMAGILEDNA